jgi:hypothetical protein
MTSLRGNLGNPASYRTYDCAPDTDSKHCVVGIVQARFHLLKPLFELRVRHLHLFLLRIE